MVHGENRIPYWIDRRLTGLAEPDYDATISFGLPFEPEDSQYGESRLNDARVHDRPLPKPQSLGLQIAVDLLEQTLPQLMLFQQMAEVQDRRLVRQWARQLQPYEPSHRLDLVEHVLHTRIAQSLPRRRPGL